MLWLALMVGCPDKPAEVPADDSTPPPDTRTGPCADGGWGPFDGPEGVVVVATSGGDATSVEEGLALADTSRPGVLITEGEWTTRLELRAGDQDGITLAGCSATGSVLVAPDDEDHLLRVDGASEVTLRRLTLRGGRRTLWIEAPASVHLAELSLQESVRVGILVLGAATVDLTDVEILDVQPEEVSFGTVGYGMSLDGTATAAASISMEGACIRGSTGVALLAQAADLTIVDSTIEGTLADTSSGVPLLGRAIQLQSFSTLHMTGSTLSDNADAAIFSVGSLSVVVSDAEIRNTTAAATAAGGASETGDGLVAIRGTDTSGLGVDAFTVALDGVTVDGNDRAGVLLEDVTLSAATAVSGTNGYTVDGKPIVAQGAADVSAAPDLAGTAPSTLPLNLTTIQADAGS